MHSQRAASRMSFDYTLRQSQPLDFAGVLILAEILETPMSRGQADARLGCDPPEARSAAPAFSKALNMAGRFCRFTSFVRAKEGT